MSIRYCQYTQRRKLEKHVLRVNLEGTLYLFDQPMTLQFPFQSNRKHREGSLATHRYGEPSNLHTLLSLKEVTS